MDEKNNDIDFIKLHFDVDREALSVWVLKLTDLIPRKSLPKFEEYEKAIFGEIRAQMNLESMKDDVILRSYRNLYWTFGMDPTKLRVSSEALVRRIL
ncbi:MAG: hypothetical protein ACFE7R_07325, partial [Candidatus Hodarchaeota archaeon]